MKKTFNLLVYILLISLLIIGCQAKSKVNITHNSAKGKLFIIGGGKRPPSLVQKMISEAGIKAIDRIAILPMSSAEPDTSFFYAKKQFVDLGYPLVDNFFFNDSLPAQKDSLEKLLDYQLIYLPGGDQNRFMKIIEGTKLKKVLSQAYQKGALIAGTSAGAALMSERMITGNEKKYPEYATRPASLESDNIELAEGLGFLQTAIIDQHFVRRSRYNRTISTAIEYPNMLSIGIDESTAIIVSGDSAKVTGKAQVVVIENPEHSKNIKKGYLGAKNLSMSIYLEGEKFKIYQ